MEPLSQPSTSLSAADGAVQPLSNPAAEPPSVLGFLRSYLTPAGKQALWNLGWLVAGTVVSQACGLIGVLVLTRALSPEQFGIYAFSMTLYGYLIMFAAAGMGSVVIREVTRRPQDRDKILGAFVGISLAASVLVSGLTWLAVQLTSASTDEKFLIGCLALANLATCGQLFPFLDAHHRQALGAVVSSLVELVSLCLLLAFFVAGSLTISVAGVLVILRSLCIMAGTTLAYRRVTGSLRLRVSVQETTRIMRSAGGLLLAQLIAMIPLTSGVFLVRFFHGDVAAGVMGLAVMTLKPFLQMVALAIRVVFPHIAGPHGEEHLFQRKLWAFFLCYLALLFFGILAGVWIVVTYLLASDYAPVFVVGFILLAGGVIRGIAALHAQFLLAEHREREFLRAHFVSSVVFLCLAVPGAMHWSYPGVAASLFVSALTFLILTQFIRRRLGNAGGA